MLGKSTILISFSYQLCKLAKTEDTDRQEVHEVHSFPSYVRYDRRRVAQRQYFSLDRKNRRKAGVEDLELGRHAIT